ncbi:MAG: hypothetical protein CW342_10025 [Thermoactinomycetaceae bacterium]|nr:hypothetical protein [Thermoactinomycetaceae bacterium]
MTANRLTSFLLMVIVFSPITDIFSDALWDDNITDAQQRAAKPLTDGEQTGIIHNKFFGKCDEEDMSRSTTVARERGHRLEAP